MSTDRKFTMPEEQPDRRAEPYYEPGYRRAIKFVYLAMLVAVGVTLYSLFMALTGTGGFPGKGH